MREGAGPRMAGPCHRSDGKESGCPYCSGRLASAATSLAALRPDLAALWDVEKNHPVTPADVTVSSGRQFWWTCPVATDHRWKTSPNRLTNKGSRCPCCSGFQASATNCIATVAPEAVKLWHPSKNLPATPTTVVAGTEKKFWWQCPKGHEWHTTAKSVALVGTGCRYCAGQVLDPQGSNSLKAKYPDLAEEWHPTRNKLRPDRVLAGGSTKYWWRCAIDNSHEWEALLSNRIARHSGCPICSGHKTIPATSLQARFPGIAAEWHPTKNGNATPATVAPGTPKLYWWKCPKWPDHEWQASPNRRTGQGSGCPTCNRGWTAAALEAFVRAIRPHIHAFDPAELFVLLRQNGMLDSQNTRAFAREVLSGRFPATPKNRLVWMGRTKKVEYASATRLPPTQRRPRRMMPSSR